MINKQSLGWLIELIDSMLKALGFIISMAKEKQKLIHATLVPVSLLPPGTLDC
jgi:hypothetical protein